MRHMEVLNCLDVTVKIPRHGVAGIVLIMISFSVCIENVTHVIIL